MSAAMSDTEGFAQEYGPRCGKGKSRDVINRESRPYSPHPPNALPVGVHNRIELLLHCNRQLQQQLARQQEQIAQLQRELEVVRRRNDVRWQLTLDMFLRAMERRS